MYSYHPPENSPLIQTPQAPANSGINYDIAQRKAELRYHITAKEDDLRGCFGCAFQIWLVSMIVLCSISAINAAYHLVNLIYLDGFSVIKTETTFIWNIIYCGLLVYQCFLARSAMGNRDFAKAKRAWKLMAGFFILCLFVFAGGLFIDSLKELQSSWELYLIIFVILYLIPLGGNLVGALIVKIILEEREKYVLELESISDKNGETSSFIV